MNDHDASHQALGLCDIPIISNNDELENIAAMLNKIEGTWWKQEQFVFTTIKYQGPQGLTTQRTLAIIVPILLLCQLNQLRK